MDERDRDGPRSEGPQCKDPGAQAERHDVKDDIWARNEIESPCVKICVIHPDAKICLGCYRTIPEIGAWSSISASERRRIMDDLPARAASLVKRRGGRAARIARNEG